MSYVHGFLLAVPNDKKDAYVKMASDASKIFKENGAVSVVETWGVDVPDGKVTSFPMAVKLEDDETVVFSWIVWPDAETGKTGMEKAMKHFEAQGGSLSDMPFDGMRMMWGSFETIVEV